MDIVKKTIELLKQVFLNRMFWIGMLICFAMFSKYILGPDNLVEQLGEKFSKDSLGIEVDFSPENDKQ
jgi:hypothetical protein